MILYKMTLGIVKEYIKDIYGSKAVAYTDNEDDALDFDPWDNIVNEFIKQGFSCDYKKGKQKRLVL